MKIDPPNHGARWSSEGARALNRQFDEGAPLSVMAQLHGRSASSIAQQLANMGRIRRDRTYFNYLTLANAILWTTSDIRLADADAWGEAPFPGPTILTEDADGAPYPDGVWRHASGALRATCRGCDEYFPVEEEWLTDWNPDMAYCGGSPRCCP